MVDLHSTPILPARWLAESTRQTGLLGAVKAALVTQAVENLPVLRRPGFGPWSVTIPRAVEQLSLGSTPLDAHAS